MVTRIVEEAGYKTYQGNTIDTKVNSCISAVEDIIETFSRKDIETCKNCKRLIIDIIAFHLVGGHEQPTREREEVTNNVKGQPY